MLQCPSACVTLTNFTKGRSSRKQLLDTSDKSRKPILRFLKYWKWSLQTDSDVKMTLTDFKVKSTRKVLYMQKDPFESGKQQ